MTPLLTSVFLPGPATRLQLPILIQRIILLLHLYAFGNPNLTKEVKMLKVKTV